MTFSESCLPPNRSIHRSSSSRRAALAACRSAQAIITTRLRKSGEKKTTSGPRRDLLVLLVPASGGRLRGDLLATVLGELTCPGFAALQSTELAQGDRRRILVLVGFVRQRLCTCGGIDHQL